MNTLSEKPIAKIVPGTYDPIKEFSTYMLDFYGPGGIYDQGFTADEVLQGTVTYIHSGREFIGDSVDREAIRDIILAKREG